MNWRLIITPFIVDTFDYLFSPMLEDYKNRYVVWLIVVFGGKKIKIYVGEYF